MLIFYVFFLLTGLGGIFLFGAGKLFCFSLLAAAGAGIVLWLLHKTRRFSGLLIPVCLVLCLFSGQSVSEGGVMDYYGRRQEIKTQIDRGNMEQAVELLDVLDREFGVTDWSCCARAEICLNQREYDEALLSMNKVQDRSSQYWYEYMERIYGLQGTEAAMAKLKELYLAGAKDLPENQHMQFMAGLVRLEQGALESAAYYFRCAKNLNKSDGLPCYYLGVVCVSQGKNDEAAGYFDEALQLGVDEEKTENIRWYQGQ